MPIKELVLRTYLSKYGREKEKNKKRERERKRKTEKKRERERQRSIGHYKFQSIVAIDRSSDPGASGDSISHFSDAGQIGYAGELISANHRHAPAKSMRGMDDTYDTHATHDEPHGRS